MKDYFAFLRERYSILLARRAGEPFPWTADPVLQAWRFCNVRREDDKVTIWFRENIRDPLRDSDNALFATMAFRWFNTIAAGEILKPFLLEDRWDRDEIQSQLEDLMYSGTKIFTGAFMINSAPGKPKHIDILDNLDGTLLKGPGKLTYKGQKERLFREILRVPRLGNFAAYQVVVDLQYTCWLEDAPDLNTFTVAGPGCARGIGLCFFDDADHFNYGSKAHQKDMLELMKEAWEASRDPENWPSEWPTFVLSDIENSFCEYLKWRNGHKGLRLKRKYQV